MAQTGHIIKIDVTGTYDKLGKAFSELAKGHRDKIMARSINKVAGPALTFTRRGVRDSGGFKYGYVVERTKLIRASSGRLEATIRAVDRRYSNLRQFGARLNSAGVSAAPWKKRRTFAHAFIIDGKRGVHATGQTGLVVHRVGPKVASTRKGRRFDQKLKPLYGANVAREMEREPFRSSLMHRINSQLEPEVMRYAPIYIRSVGAKYGLC
jgi:hypothetical protein